MQITIDLGSTYPALKLWIEEDADVINLALEDDDETSMGTALTIDEAALLRSNLYAFITKAQANLDLGSADD